MYVYVPGGERAKVERASSRMYSSWLMTPGLTNTHSSLFPLSSLNPACSPTKIHPYTRIVQYMKRCDIEIRLCTYTYMLGHKGGVGT